MEFESHDSQVSLSMSRKVLGVSVLVAGALIAVFVSVVGVALAASQVSAPLLIFVCGLAASAVSAWLLSYGAAKLFRRSRPASFAGKAAIVMTAVIGATTLWLLSPGDVERSIPMSDTNAVEFWDLDTGSRVAVRQVASKDTTSFPSIIFLHGGPGAYSVSLEPLVATLSNLADDGYSVYFYDQVGGGLSARLSDVTEYTFDRHLSDLDAIIRRIDNGPVILIGSSFGASLAANYMARYPDNVVAAVMSGSAPMFFPHYAETGDGKIDDVLNTAQRAKMRDIVETPQVFVALGLTAINPNAAARFAPDSELGALFDRVANEVYLPAIICAGNKVAFYSNGIGFWSNRMTGRTLKDQVYDPRPELSNNTSPVLVIRGDCDYKKIEVASEYVEVFPDARLITMPKAGHMPFLEQPTNYLKHVRDFLEASHAQSAF
ncbi:MAG: alpha/beta fold hydrolase [Pseudomonadota bacterium]